MKIVIKAQKIKLGEANALLPPYKTAIVCVQMHTTRKLIEKHLKFKILQLFLYFQGALEDSFEQIRTLFLVAKIGINFPLVYLTNLLSPQSEILIK